jgi:hypothetical protein
MNYEETKDAFKESRMDGDGVWISFADLWRIDAVACRNGIKAMNDKDIPLFQAFVGQRMLISEIADKFQPKEI